MSWRAVVLAAFDPGRRDATADVTVQPCRVREGVIEIDPGPGSAGARDAPERRR